MTTWHGREGQNASPKIDVRLSTTSTAVGVRVSAIVKYCGMKRPTVPNIVRRLHAKEKLDDTLENKTIEMVEMRLAIVWRIC